MKFYIGKASLKKMLDSLTKYLILRRLIFNYIKVSLQGV